MQALFHEAGIGIAFISQWGRVLDANPCLTSFLGTPGRKDSAKNAFPTPCIPRTAKRCKNCWSS